VNRDFAPEAYEFDVVLWSAQFKSGYAEWFRAAEHVSFRRVAGTLAVLLAILVTLLAFFPGRGQRKRAAAGSCVAATGFTLMALQIFLLLGFQAVYGYVYTELAILVGLLMAGIALGSWLAMRRGDEPGGWRMAEAQFLLVLAGPALLVAVSLSRSSSTLPVWVAAQLIFPALAVLTGMLGGYQFVVATRTFLRGRGERWGLGALYAIDLLGGCAGALALSGFLIPVFGFWKSAWLGAGINVAAVLLAVRVAAGGSAGQKHAALGGIAPDSPDIPRRKSSKIDSPCGNSS
jgi:hypothetical protein